MPQPDISGNFVYGVSIHIPHSPSWKVMIKRLGQVEAIPSLFATAARATTDKDLADQLDSELVAKRAKAVQPVLISNKKDEDEEEQEEDEEEEEEEQEEEEQEEAEEEEEEQEEEEESEDLHENGTVAKIETAASSAIDKILGKGHGLCMALHAADGDSYDAEPALLLELAGSRKEVDLGPGVLVFAVTQNLTDIPNKEAVDANIRRVLDRLGLEAKTNPGWQFCSIHSEYN